MNWEDIIKNKKKVLNFIKLAKDNMDKFDKDEKELIKYYINFQKINMTETHLKH